MIKRYELNHQELLEAVAMYVSVKEKVDLPLHVQLCTNGQAPVSDPPYASEQIRVWAVATKEEQPNTTEGR